MRRSSDAVIELTKSLRDTPVEITPVEIEGWIRRAAELLNLGYPDLAAGDAYKAKLLVDAMLSGLWAKRTELPMDLSKNFRVLAMGWDRAAYQRLLAALQMMGDHEALQKICKEGKERYQGRDEAGFGSVTFFDEISEADRSS